MIEEGAVGVKEAARLLAVSEPTVWRLIRARRIEAVRPAGMRRTLICRSALAAFLQRHTVPVQPE